MLWKLVSLVSFLVQQKTQNISWAIIQYKKELGNCYYLIWLLPKPFILDLCVVATLFQYLSKVLYKNYILNKAFILLSYMQQFKYVFVKEDFNIFSDHYKQDYAIKLIPGAESKLSKVYFLKNTSAAIENFDSCIYLVYKFSIMNFSSLDYSVGVRMNPSVQYKTTEISTHS